MKSDYDRISRTLADVPLVFLNYGFADPDAGPPAWIEDVDRSNRHHLALVRKVLDGAALEGKTVLEVGCGRGGNCSYIARYENASRVLGIDRCTPSIAFCSRMHRIPNVRFIVGSAERLPVRDASIDVILNLESAHCYERFDVFLSEVRRVLRPGGLFRFADVWDWAVLPCDWKRREVDLAASGLVVESEHDISRGVLEALEREDGFHATLASVTVPAGGPLIRRLIRGADALRSSLTLGLCRYRAWHMRKPGRI